MMKINDQLVKLNHNPNWPYIPDHPYRVFIIVSLRSGKTNVLWTTNAKDPSVSKYQLLINGRGKVGIKNLKNPKAFIDYSQKIDDIYENLEDYNQTKKRKLLIVFDDGIADLESSKKLSPIVTEFFSRGRKLNISLTFFLSQSHFKVTKTINATHYFIIKIPNKRELLRIASNHSPDIDLKYFVKLYKDYTKELYSFLVNNTT